MMLRSMGGEIEKAIFLPQRNICPKKSDGKRSVSADVSGSSGRCAGAARPLQTPREQARPSRPAHARSRGGSRLLQHAGPSPGLNPGVIALNHGYKAILSYAWSFLWIKGEALPIYITLRGLRPARCSPG